ncbi:hypothetical protein SRS16CHR_02578 [Variovorax sp. SRS16]|nr:hypothetical protein SRS16CHR_02578 [Variovorax sp. SRS16]
MEIFGITFTAYMFWKLVALAVLAGVVNFIYSFRTGRNLSDDLEQLQQQERSAKAQAMRERAGP